MPTTPTSSAAASAQATPAPTSNAPASPGPRVNATASIASSAHAGIGQHLPRQRQHAADVVARGQFRHDAAELAVHLDLAVQRLRDQPRRARGSAHATSATPVSSHEDSMPRTFIAPV